MNPTNSLLNRAFRYLTLAVSILCGCSQASGQGYSPEEAASRMTVADGFAVELVAAEPLVRQPVAIDFDDRGRLWAFQYLQYPNPAGLKRVKVDRYSRTTYDRVPKPPPHGPKGADRLTILEDTDGDGRMDRSKDFLSDLNIATGFQFGYGGVFVLQTPYLLFYPDRNNDDVPDSDPEVLLTGFGMEDTSSLANSLVWGPDGWLYGTQGTNLTADIRGVQFEQGVWRYHPVTRKFELFIEGGSNMWGLDFDRHGNLLAGTNYGGFLMFHCVQGAYYQKSFAKHGELSNRFAFGYFQHVAHERFRGGHVTVGGVVYQGDAFPERFRDKYIAVDTLGHAVRWHHVTRHASTFRSTNGGVLLQANDSWFAPSDCVVGSDGALYVADWHDKRTAHPDPDATWDRSNGRVFRLKWKEATPTPHMNPGKLSNEELVKCLSSRNEWRARRARRVLAERRGKNVATQLRTDVLEVEDTEQVLKSLWSLAAVGKFDEEIGGKLLDDTDANVRAWAVRLLGDQERVSADVAHNLIRMAASDDSPTVISQLAATAKRLPAVDCIPLARALAERGEFHSDPHIPLLLWWAVERYAISAADDVLDAFSNAESWQTPIVRNAILARLMRRFAGDGSETGFEACATLFKTAPDRVQRRRMLAELDAGLRMLGRKKLPRLPLPENRLAIKRIEDKSGGTRLNSVPPALIDVLADLWDDQTTDSLTIRVSARLGSSAAIARAVALATDASRNEKTRLEMLAVLQELGDAGTCIDPALTLVRGSDGEAIRLAALNLLSRFAGEQITYQLLGLYGKMNEPLRSRTRDVLLARSTSALAFLRAIERGDFPPEEVPIDQLRRVALHNAAKIDAIVRKHWGNIRAGTPEEKLAEIRRINNDLRAGTGSVAAGRLVFEKRCASCHKLFGTGKEIGPDLTKANRGDRDYLLVSMVDPSSQIRKEYLSFIVVTVDGRVVTGVLAEESDATVTILGAKNERTTISRDDIEEFKASPVSLMPENILKELTPQEVRDLFRYLQSNGPPQGKGQ